MHTIPVATGGPELEGSTMERSQEVSGHHTHTLGWVLSKQTKPPKITHIKENVEKLETLCTVQGNVKWCGHCEKQYNSPAKN